MILTSFLAFYAFSADATYSYWWLHVFVEILLIVVFVRCREPEIERFLEFVLMVMFATTVSTMFWQRFQLDLCMALHLNVSRWLHVQCWQLYRHVEFILHEKVFWVHVNVIRCLDVPKLLWIAFGFEGTKAPRRFKGVATNVTLRSRSFSFCGEKFRFRELKLSLVSFRFA